MQYVKQFLAKKMHINQALTLPLVIIFRRLIYSSTLPTSFIKSPHKSFGMKMNTDWAFSSSLMSLICQNTIFQFISQNLACQNSFSYWNIYRIFYIFLFNVQLVLEQTIQIVV